MARADRAELARKQRERKQKILLLFMVLLLAILVVWQGPKTLNRLKGGSSAAPATSTSTQPGATSATPGASSGAPAAAATPATTDPQAALAAEKKALGDTDTPPVADQDQLISFSRFSARDPFVQLVSTTETTTTPAAPPSMPTTPPTSGGTTYPPPSSSGDTTTGQVALSINGASETHVVGDTFPANDPAFKIVSVNGSTVQIGLASGQFSGGQQTIGVKVGEEVTLVSQPDGARYTIKVLSIS